MGSEITATFEIKAWDEQPFDEADGVAKLTKASVAKAYVGEVQGASTTEWLMAYDDDGSAAFVGLERIRGSIGARKGTLVLQHVGRFEAGAAKAVLTVLSGTGDLQGASGTGQLVADPAGRITLTLDIGD
jgi:hypothetical protein